MNSNHCIFCDYLKNTKIIMENELAFAIYDAFPVNKGHVLVMPKRHFANFFDATTEEMMAFNDLLQSLTEDEKDLVTECELFSSPWDISSPGCSWYCNGTIHEVFASSFLESEGGHTYDPENIADECLDTVWAEGVPGSGIGESVTYRVSGPISGISIYNGYGKTDELFLNNNRVKKLRVLIAEKTEYIIELFDIRNEQVIFLESNKYENVTIKFEILDVYRGLKYDDTCVSEIQFLGGH
jgi:hypothetical protein